MELLGVLDVKDTEKCRKMVIIHVDSCEIRLKVLRVCGFGASRRILGKVKENG